MAKLSDLASQLGPQPMEEEETEESVIVFSPPSGFRMPDDARSKREFEQVVSLIDMGDGRLRLTKIGGIPLGDEESSEEEEEEIEVDEEEETESSPESLDQAIAMEREMRGI